MFKQSFNSIAKQLNRYSATSVRTMSSYDPASFLLNHTCLRVKDPKASIEYYTKNYGLKLIHHQQNPKNKFDLYFLCQNDQGGSPFNREGVLELTHNYGTENDPDYKINNGNDEPHRGFGHICFSVDNIQAASEELLKNGVSFKKKLTDGRQKNIAFALDPDGYWVELIENGLDKLEGATNTDTYKFNHTMIRIKDPAKSLKFYREVLGMKLLSTKTFESAKFTLYFLAYDHSASFTENSLQSTEQSKRESILELTHNWGTENDPEFKYHNGNEQPQGYGHIGISLDNPGAFCEELEKKYGDELTWGLKFNKGYVKNIAFIKDPDNYAVEILPSSYDFK